MAKRKKRKKPEAVHSLIPAPVHETSIASLDPISRLVLNAGSAFLDFVGETIKESPVFRATQDLGIIDEADLMRMKAQISNEIQSAISPGSAPEEEPTMSEYQRGRLDVLRAVARPPES